MPVQGPLDATRIGTLVAGRKVTFCMGQTLAPGASVSSNRRMRTARTMVASCSAKDEPMQGLGPTPKRQIEKTRDCSSCLRQKTRWIKVRRFQWLGSFDPRAQSRAADNGKNLQWFH